MSGTIDLADPDFEPSDADLQGLSTRAFAGVADSHARQLARLRAEISAERDRVLLSLLSPSTASRSPGR